MFDSTKLVSPLDVIIDSITPNIDRIVLEKDKTKVITLNAITPYYNTQATVCDVNPITESFENYRNIVYDRIDIGKFIDKVATVNELANGQREYVLISDEVETTTYNAGAALLTRVVNGQYDLPILPEDLKTVVPTPHYVKSSSFGDLYLLANATVLGDTVSYINGTVSVYNRDDTSQFDYNKIKTTQCGMMFYRVWDADEILEVTLPNIDTAESWAIQIEDVDRIDHVGDGRLYIKVWYNNEHSQWVCHTPDNQVYFIDADTITKLRISVIEGKTVVSGLTLVNNNEYVPQFDYVISNTVYRRGLNRVTIHSNNPVAPTVSFKFNTKVNPVSSKSSLKVNDTEYVKRINTLGAADGSNALFGVIAHPIKITRYDTKNYRQLGIRESFEGLGTKGSISTIDSFKNEFIQTVRYTFADIQDYLASNKIKEFTITVKSLDDVNTVYTAHCQLSKNSDGVVELAVTTKVNGVVTFITTKPMIGSVLDISVDITPYEINVFQGDNVISTTTALKYTYVRDQLITKRFKVSLDLEVTGGSKLPNIDISKEYDSLIKL